MSLKEISQLLDSKIAPLEKSLNFVLEQCSDPWECIHTEISAIAHQRGCSHLPAISAYYNIPEQNYCMVLGQVTHCDIFCAHIWPAHTAGRGLETLGLQAVDVSNAKNFLRLHKCIEKAFDRKSLTFLPVETFQHIDQVVKLKVVVLNPDLLSLSLVFYKGSPIQLTFNDINNREFDITFHASNLPFLRLITLHAQRAFQKAEDNGWINHLDATAKRARAKELARKSLEGKDTNLVMERCFKDL